MPYRPIEAAPRAQSPWQRFGALAPMLAAVTNERLPWQVRGFFIALTVLVIAVILFDLWKTSRKGAAFIANIPYERPSVRKSFLDIVTARSPGDKPR